MEKKNRKDAFGNHSYYKGEVLQLWSIKKSERNMINLSMMLQMAGD